MNTLQSKIMENINLLPENMLQEVVDFSEFLKYKYEKSKSKQKLIDRVKEADENIKNGKFSEVSPQELFKEIGA